MKLARMLSSSIYALVLTLAACGPSVAVQRAQTLYDQGDFAGAASSADADLRGAPDDDQLWQVRVRAALAQADGAGIAAQYASYRAARGGVDDNALLADMATATIRQGLASPSTPAKVRAIQTVEDLMLMELADAVARLMEDADDRVSAAAAIAVLRGYPGAAYAATDALSSDDPAARRIATIGIGAKVGELAGNDLRKMARDPNAGVRAAAIAAIAGFVDDASRAAVDAALGDADDSVRATAADALARRPGGATAAQADTALADAAPGVRMAGVDIVAARHDDARLRALLADADPSVALRAATLRRAPTDAAVRAVFDRAAADSRHSVRAAAINGWAGVFGKLAAAQQARAMLGDAAATVRRAAARALAYAEPAAQPQATAVLLALLDEPKAAAIHLTVAAELAALHNARGDDALSAALLVTSPARRALAVALHLTIAHRVTPALIAALADADGLVRILAADALLHLTS